MCTKITVKDKANNVVSMRTMEAAIDLEYEVAIIPRNYELPMSYNEEISGLGTYKSKYAVIGVRDFLGLYGSKTAIHEGMNEKGLAVGGNAFRKVCKYPLKDPKQFEQGNFDGEQLINYILGNFADISEVREFMAENEGNIFLDPRLEFNSSHFHISDATGKSILIEPVEGKFKILDNPMNVVTNAPHFESHVANLSNYMHLSPYDATNSMNFQNEKLGDYTDMSSGTGANGLPGNSYSMSRFVRAAFFQRTAVLDDNVENTIRTMWSIANHFDIPFGSNREHVNPVHKRTAGAEYWIWSDFDNNEVVDQSVLTMVQDQTNGILQYKDWKNNSIRQVNLHDYDLDAEEVVSISVYKDGSDKVQEITLK